MVRVTQNNKERSLKGKMAFALLHVNRPVEGIFKERVPLGDVRDYDLRNYRLPRRIIQDLTRGFENSPFSNHTERSNAIPAETQVSIMYFSLIFYIPCFFSRNR